MNSDCPKKGASRRAAANSMPRLARPPVKARGNSSCWRQTLAATRDVGVSSISERTVGFRIRAAPRLACYRAGIRRRFGCNDGPAVHMWPRAPGVLFSRSLISFKEDLTRNGSYYGEVEDCGRPGGWRPHVGRRWRVCRREREQHHHGGEPGSDCSAEWWADVDLGRQQDAHASDQLRQPGRMHLVLCEES